MKRILLVCDGNTCRSPMAKAILEQILSSRGLTSKISVDSAAIGTPTLPTATEEAKKVIKQLYGKDLLANHKSKSITQISFDDFDLILAMQERHKRLLPQHNTYTLKEYAGIKGDINDPWSTDLEAYRKCRDEIKHCLEIGIERIINDC